MTPKVVFASAAMALSLGFAAPASSAAFVLGGGLADACSRFAVDGRSDEYSLSTCTYALETESLVKRDRAATLVNRGVIQLRRKKYEAANRDFDAAIRLQPGMGEAYVNRGAALLAQRRWAEGKADIDRGLELGSDEPEKAYFNRALAWEALDDMEAAWRDYVKASELKPDWDAPRKELARFTVTPK
ncbi:MAG: tetratricopeptide repeat protein [Caulobacter sp.]|nr:tetratricopeptide repeat protein [Caulobacter sp.]